ncbi:MAG: histidine phosphatase family protein, partial [Fibrella sp.]|nr:histidine phosphatase family protein [Armatimonadota bacterium]
ETEVQVFERMSRALLYVFANTPTVEGGSHRNVVIYGHGGSLRVFLCLSLGLGAQETRRFRLENTSLSVIEISGIVHSGELEIRNGRFVCVNETAHLLLPEFSTPG